MKISNFSRFLFFENVTNLKLCKNLKKFKNLPNFIKRSIFFMKIGEQNPFFFKCIYLLITSLA